MKLVEGHNDKVYVRKNFWTVVATHVIALGVAPFFFSWQALAFGLGTAFLFGYAMGIFHHMYLSHDSFAAHPWIVRGGTLLGTLTWRGPFAAPIRYVAMHRIHHKYSDTPLDPHTPADGLWHALLGWFWRMPYGFTQPELYETYAPTLVRDPWLRFLDRNVDLLQAAWGLVAFGIGYAVGGDLKTALAFLIYGVFVRTFLSNYAINTVDVINHAVGYRNFDTGDRSTNSFLMAFIHGGGAISWHNNHHARPQYFTVRERWWEFDVHYLLLRALAKAGLVTNIKCRN